MSQLSEKEIRERLDPVCDAFEAAWLRGERPLLSDLVQNAAPEIRSPLFMELLGIELEFRNQDNEVLGPAEYESRYPEFTAEIQTTFRIELRARGEELLKTSSEISQSPETPAVATDSAITRTRIIFSKWWTKKLLILSASMGMSLVVALNESDKGAS